MTDERRNCSHAAPAHHTGWLQRETPGSPLLDPPVEILRCEACGAEYRADGAPYDAEARVDIWRVESVKERI